MCANIDIIFDEKSIEISLAKVCWYLDGQHDLFDGFCKYF